MRTTLLHFGQHHVLLKILGGVAFASGKAPVLSTVTIQRRSSSTSTLAVEHWHALFDVFGFKFGRADKGRDSLSTPSSANLGCLSADHTDMDILLSALASDLVSRLVSFVVDKCRKQAATEKLARLQNLLLRARAVVEEAEGRHITNRGMLLQLQELREAMYRGYYMLHAHTCKKETIDQSSEKRHAEVSQSFHLDSLQRVLHSLESTIGDMKEFAVLLMDCPRIVRQPYSTYLFMDRCMFGRHAEKEKIMDFLLQPCSFLAVLPIIGPCEVGKRTLVEHVCIDKKVRKHFCQVQHLTGDNLDRDQPFQYSRGRSLIVIEFLLHVGEEAWRRFYSSICQTNSDSKIIIISRMKQVASFGTVQALELKRLHQYEFYYFFKVLAFGSANPDDHHPVLTAIATNLASESKCSFIAANVIARLLQTNLNAHFWRHVQKMVREIIQLYCAHFGEHPLSLSWKNRPHYYCGYFRESLEDASLFLAYDRRGNFTQKELPKLTLHDLITGAGRSIPCEDEKFNILVWQSSIPPYYSYISNCAVKKDQQAMNKNKGRLKRKRKLGLRVNGL